MLGGAPHPLDGVAVHPPSALESADEVAADARTADRAVGHAVDHLHLRDHRPVEGRDVVLRASACDGGFGAVSVRRRPLHGQSADVPLRRRDAGDGDADPRRLDRDGRCLQHRSVLADGAKRRHHDVDPARRHGRLSAQAAALPRRQGPSVADLHLRAAQRNGAAISRPLRHRHLHALQHDRNLACRSSPAPIRRRSAAPAGRVRASRSASSTRTIANCRVGAVGELVVRTDCPWATQPRLCRQSGGDGGRLAQRLVPHRRRLSPRRGGQFLFRRPAERRHPPARRKYLLVRGRVRGAGLSADPRSGRHRGARARSPRTKSAPWSPSRRAKRSTPPS